MHLLINSITRNRCYQQVCGTVSTFCFAGFCYIFLASSSFTRESRTPTKIQSIEELWNSWKTTLGAEVCDYPAVPKNFMNQCCCYLICSAHPYLFFNDDESSITFVGFKVSKAGDLLHPGTGAILRKAVVSQGLMEDLKRYGVDLNEDWMSWWDYLDFNVFFICLDYI